MSFKKNKKKTAKTVSNKLPSLANHPIHTIPINLMESIGSSVPQSASSTTNVAPFGHVPQSATYNPILPFHPAYFVNPLSYYWPLYGQPNILSQKSEPDDTENLHQAATLIQKIYRGHAVRKEYLSLAFNPVVRVRNPPLYWTEFLLHEIIHDFIIDCLVEICQTGYFPFSRQLQAPNLLYHVIEQMTYEVAFKVHHDAKLKKKGIILTEKWESAEQLFLLEELNHFTKEILLESVNERVENNLLEISSDVGFSILQEEIIRDDIMTVLYDVIIGFVYDKILQDLISLEVFRLAPDLCKAAKVSLILYRPSKQKSKRIDLQMDQILEEIIIEELALALSSPPLENELDDEINYAIINILLLHL